MARLLKGVEVAKNLTERFQTRTAQLLSERGLTPGLGIIRAGTREDDLSYERGAMKRCEKIGIAVYPKTLSENASESEVLQAIQNFNQNPDIHGILIFRPLPSQIRDESVCHELSSEKDVDGITDGAMSALYSGHGTGFPPCTAEACVALLKHYQIPITGKRVVIIGRSLVIGKPVAMLFLAENSTVTICHSRSENLSDICREADILIAAAGKAGLVSKEFVRPDQVILDVGIHVDENTGKLCGDVRFEEVEPIVSAITPVPGGIGAVTSTILAGHVLNAAEHLVSQS